MCMEYRTYREEIKHYCETHRLDFEKLNTMVKGCGADHIAILYHDPQKGEKGLLDETPMPIVLWVTRRKDGEMIFKQTEHTKRYLSQKNIETETGAVI